MNRRFCLENQTVYFANNEIFYLLPMDNKVMKRRGRPNRGGGRFNRGRGRGTRGRGRPVEAADSGHKQHGHGGRKGGDDYMYDFDDGLDDAFDGADYRPSQGSNSQGREGIRRGTSSRSHDGQTFHRGRFV